MPPGGGVGGALATGRRWRNYQIGEACPGMPGMFRATDVSTLEEVHIVSRPLQGDGTLRREAWTRLDGLSLAHLVPLLEANEEGEWRYEVTAIPAGTSLREWIRCHQISLPEIERLVHQISVALEVLHDNGVVHLRVRPDNIYVQEGNQLTVSLGGLADATLHARPDFVPFEVDGYYEPPEAAGLFRHQPGTGLCAWDWWSLGRVVQEVIHGGHVYGALFERDVSAAPPELKARVDAALSDRDPSGVRAGAVELLPEQAGPRVRSLLRGLLASSRDGRWGAEQIHLWLQGAPAPDRYDLARDARLFVWRRRAFTFAEAAEFFSQPDYAIEGQAQFFPLIDEPGTMRRFLADTPQFRAEHERVGQVLALADMASWQQQPLHARRSAVAGLAWLAVAPPSGRPALCVQRWKIDARGLQEMFADAPPPEALNLARVLVNSSFRRSVEALDPAAGRVLEVLAEHGFAALERALQAGWIGAGDADAQCRLLRYSLDAEKDLLIRRDRLRAAYASHRDERLAALLAGEKPGRVDLALLACTGEHARESGYITHAEWDQQNAARLLQRGNQIARAVFWRRLATIVVSSPAVLGSWLVFAAFWSVPLALCLVSRVWLIAAGVGGLALAMRFFARMRINLLLARYAPNAARWTWRDRHVRARTEAGAVLADLGEVASTTAGLLAELRGIRKQISRLKLKPAAPLPGLPPSMREFWLGAVAGAVVPVSLCVMLFILAGRVPAVPEVAAQSERLPPEDVSATAAATEIFETYFDGFGKRVRGPLQAWDVPSTAPTRPAIVRRMATASPDQRAYALVGAELLLDPYPREGLDVMLAVPVPAGSEWGFVLYDSLRRELVDRRAFFIADPLVEKSWYWVGNRRVVYLGAPPRLPAQFTLAPP